MRSLDSFKVFFPNKNSGFMILFFFRQSGECHTIWQNICVPSEAFSVKRKRLCFIPFLFTTTFSFLYVSQFPQSARTSSKLIKPVWEPLKPGDWAVCGWHQPSSFNFINKVQNEEFQRDSLLVAGLATINTSRQFRRNDLAATSSCLGAKAQQQNLIFT